jgi:hypothetical protein
LPTLLKGSTVKAISEESSKASHVFVSTEAFAVCLELNYVPGNASIMAQWL